MRLVDVAARLLNNELNGAPRLQCLEINLMQGAAHDWILLLFEGWSESLIADILEVVSPIRRGELIAEVGAAYVIYAEEAFLPKREPKEKFFSGSASLNVPHKLKKSLTSDVGDPSNRVVLRLEKEDPLLHTDSLRSELRERTWLRCRKLPPNLRARSVSLAVGAQRTKLIPKIENQITEFATLDGYYAAFETPEVRSYVKYNIFCGDGKIFDFKCDLQTFLKTIEYPVQRTYGYDMSVRLEFDAILPNSKDYKSIILEALSQQVPAQDALHKIVERELDEMKKRRRIRFERRRASLDDRRTVFLRDMDKCIDFGREPTNETELIILVAKLEREISKDIGAFKILEHTSQDGIDSLVKIRLHTESLEDMVTTEFEYKLSNFFKHNHPILQTQYIICWTLENIGDGIIRFGNGGIRSDGILEARMRSREWMKVLDFGDHIIYVLPLENWPRLLVR